MGYWSTHPMGGDKPLDVLNELMEIAYKSISQEKFDRFELLPSDSDEYQAFVFELKELFLKKLPLLVEVAEDSKCPWVLPYQIIAVEHRVENPRLSARIKELIEDGGGHERGYEGTEEDCPQKFAQELTEKWDGLMNGTIAFDEIALDEGLFRSLFSSLHDDEED